MGVLISIITTTAAVATYLQYHERPPRNLGDPLDLLEGATTTTATTSNMDNNNNNNNSSSSSNNNNNSIVGAV